MKQVKTLLMAIALLVGICIPQMVNAQRDITPEDLEKIMANRQEKEKRKVTLEEINLLEEIKYDDIIVNVLRKMYKEGTEGYIDEMYEIMKMRYPEEFKLIEDRIPQTKESEQLPINLVGKWINKYSDKQIEEYYADGNSIYKNGKGFEYTVKGTDITYPVKAVVFHFKWKRDGRRLTTMRVPKQDMILGDISFYPADIQKRIKEDVDSRTNDVSPDTVHYYISSFSPEEMTRKQGKDEYCYVRDISNMSAQEKNEYNKEIENWNKIKKEKEQKEYLAALERDNLQMAKLKAKAIASGNQYDYWIIGHMYEFGEGNDYMKTTICLDSALVWYKKAAAIDPKNEQYVTAVTHKIKTGGDYYEDKEKSEKEAKTKQIAQVRAAYTKKYGASYSNYLSKQGYIVKGMPIAFIREYINDFNRLGFYLLGNQVQLRLQEYQPTQRDMMQFGRAVKSYRLIAGSEQMWAFLVLNGKVVSCSKLSTVYDWIKMVD